MRLAMRQCSECGRVLGRRKWYTVVSWYQDQTGQVQAVVEHKHHKCPESNKPKEVRNV